MSASERDDLIRQNERMRMALLAIKQYAGNAVFGTWRHTVHDLAVSGLGAPPRATEDQP